MKAAPFLLALLASSSLHAAFFSVDNIYNLEGTWNEDKHMKWVEWTDPLASVAYHFEMTGEQIEETLVVDFDITFPVAPAGAKNVNTFVEVDWDGIAGHSFTRTIEPIVADCGGTPCKFEPPAWSGNPPFKFNFNPIELLIVGSPERAGQTYSVVLTVTPPSFETFSQFAYNSKTTTEWGASYYKTSVRASTYWEMDTPEPGSFALAGLGVAVLGVVRKRSLRG